MTRFPLSALAFVLLIPLASGQGFVYVPDSDPTVGAFCNSFPFGTSQATGFSYVARIPASFLDPANPAITDVAFAPCGTGTWSSGDVRIGIGHVASAIPDPFTFPTSATSTGSFLDYTEVVRGRFCWAAHANTWSPFKLGSGFVWNGTDDIAFYITHSNATVTGWNGACHRTNTEPFRLWATTSNAPVSTSSGASGLKMRLETRPVIQVPDGVSSAGTCNTIPFGSGNPDYTYVGTIPATSLDPANPVIYDVAIAPCGTGTWSAPQARIGFGHLPNPLPATFAFPVGGAGSFLDFTQYVNGPHGFRANQDEWSPLNIGSSFVWNGINDVGFFISFQNATSWPGGAAHRTATDPIRIFASGYNAALSAGSDAAGLKMTVVTGSMPLAPKYRLCVHAFPNFSSSQRMDNIPAGTTFGYTFVSLTTFVPATTGPLFGIFPDAVVWTILGFPPSPGNPLAWTWPVPSPLFPAGPFDLPAGQWMSIAGQTWDLVGVAVAPSGTVLGVTNVSRITF